MQARMMLAVRYVLMVTWECIFVFSGLHLTQLWHGLVVPPLVVALLFGGTDFARWASDLVFGPNPSPAKALSRLVLLALPLTFVVISVGAIVPTSVLDFTDAYLLGLLLAFLHWVMVACNLGPSFGELIARYKDARDDDYRRAGYDVEETDHTDPAATPHPGTEPPAPRPDGTGN